MSKPEKDSAKGAEVPMVENKGAETPITRSVAGIPVHTHRMVYDGVQKGERKLPDGTIRTDR